MERGVVRHGEDIKRLLEDMISVSEIQRVLERWGVHVSAPTLHRFIVSELPRLRTATDSPVRKATVAPKVISPASQESVILPVQGRNVEAEEIRMLRLMKRHEIQVLLKARHTQSKVAELAGVSISSVRRVGKEEPVEHGDDAAAHAKRRIGRPSVVRGIQKLVQAILKARPDLDAAQILHRARLAGYQGGDSTFRSREFSSRSRTRRCSPLTAAVAGV